MLQEKEEKGVQDVSIPTCSSSTNVAPQLQPYASHALHKLPRRPSPLDGPLPGCPLAVEQQATQQCLPTRQQQQQQQQQQHQHQLEMSNTRIMAGPGEAADQMIIKGPTDLLNGLHSTSPLPASSTSGTNPLQHSGYHDMLPSTAALSPRSPPPCLLPHLQPSPVSPRTPLPPPPPPPAAGPDTVPLSLSCSHTPCPSLRLLEDGSRTDVSHMTRVVMSLSTSYTTHSTQANTSHQAHELSVPTGPQSSEQPTATQGQGGEQARAGALGPSLQAAAHHTTRPVPCHTLSPLADFMLGSHRASCRGSSSPSHNLLLPWRRRAVGGDVQPGTLERPCQPAHSLLRQVLSRTPSAQHRGGSDDVDLHAVELLGAAAEGTGAAAAAEGEGVGAAGAATAVGTAAVAAASEQAVAVAEEAAAVVAAAAAAAVQLPCASCPSLSGPAALCQQPQATPVQPQVACTPQPGRLLAAALLTSEQQQQQPGHPSQPGSSPGPAPGQAVAVTPQPGRLPTAALLTSEQQPGHPCQPGSSCSTPSHPGTLSLWASQLPAEPRDPDSTLPPVAAAVPSPAPPPYDVAGQAAVTGAGSQAGGVPEGGEGADGSLSGLDLDIDVGQDMVVYHDIVLGKVVVVITHSGFTRSILLAMQREPYRPQNTELVPAIVTRVNHGKRPSDSDSDDFEVGEGEDEDDMAEEETL
ncbi:hypothetical protein QJQ45_005926 [Haematococcus lacustris]|nr:hypothetical protein QJQ45_005926 [Haematococcus lacustris]